MVFNLFDMNYIRKNYLQIVKYIMVGLEIKYTLIYRLKFIDSLK